MVNSDVLALVAKDLEAGSADFASREAIFALLNRGVTGVKVWVLLGVVEDAIVLGEEYVLPQSLERRGREKEPHG